MREWKVIDLDRRRFLGLAAVAGATVIAGGLLKGCATGEEGTRAQTAGESEFVGEPESAAAPEAAFEPSPQPRVLVAVFSWSGHTAQVADRIHELVGGDYFRIEPAEPYTTDYNALLDAAQREQDDDYRPSLAARVGNWDEYDTVYLGFPVWWYHVPQIIKTFVTEHDLEGKTIVPFSTSGGSSVESTLDDIRALCPEASFAESITLDGDTVASQLDRVDVWLGDSGLR